MNDVARQIIVMQKRHGQPVHLHIMRFEKLLYVISVRHTSLRHTICQKLNLPPIKKITSIHIDQLQYKMA